MVESIQQFVKDKRIIFVGNSVEIMDHKLADVIDGYDIVVRFGRAIDAKPIHEESIGLDVIYGLQDSFVHQHIIMLRKNLKQVNLKILKY